MGSQVITEEINSYKADFGRENGRKPYIDP
jgi:hypothetical protein